jgi:hypothetical protein
MAELDTMLGTNHPISPSPYSLENPLNHGMYHLRLSAFLRYLRALVVFGWLNFGQLLGYANGSIDPPIERTSGEPTGRGGPFRSMSGYLACQARVLVRL